MTENEVEEVIVTPKRIIIGMRIMKGTIALCAHQAKVQVKMD